MLLLVAIESRLSGRKESRNIEAGFSLAIENRSVSSCFSCHQFFDGRSWVLSALLPARSVFVVRNRCAPSIAI